MTTGLKIGCRGWAAVLAAGLLINTPRLAAADDVPVDADVVLVGGAIHDGSGSPGVVGDVAIRGDKIVAVGKFPHGKVGLRIDCTSLLVAPGFIDLHNHSDGEIVDRRTRANVNFLKQGCTTVVTGNCGSGPIDAAAYYARISEQGAGTNVAHLLPQGNLRDAVIGNAQRAATPEEISRMSELAAKAMQDGCWGMSTGLIYVPSSYANTDELVAIAKVVAERKGIYVSHIRDEGTGLLEAVHEAMRIGREAGCPVHISHYKSSGVEAWGLIRSATELIEQARARGERVTADQYPYIASSTSVAAMLIPTWARSGGDAALIERLDHPEQGPRIREYIQRELDGRGDRAPIRIARYPPRPDWVGKSLTEIAALERRTALDVVIEITRNGGAAGVSFGMNEDDVRFAMQLPWVATASDGRAYLPGADRPHPRNYGTFPRKIGHYALREKVVSLEQAIRSSTGLPAEILGLADRGLLKPGLAADVVVIDPVAFRDTATYDDPHRYATGVAYAWVNGEAAIWRGEFTGALAGRALKKP